MLVLHFCVTLQQIQAMELGISMFGDNHFDSAGRPLSAAQRLQELVEEIKLMDEVGLDFFGIGEHHRADYAVSVPEIILAAAAPVTKQIKLGSAVTVLSSTDPVRVYQSFATVDLLSNGRAEIMAGRGSFIESYPLFGFDLDDYDALFDEKLELLLQINQSERITWKGRFRPALQNQQVLPRALQQQLPVWIAVGGTPESVVRAARYGLPVMFAIIGGNPAQFKPLVEYYRKAWQHYGNPATQLQTGVHIHAFFGANSKAVADEYFPIYAAQMNRVGSTRGWPPYQRTTYDAGRNKNGHLIIGDAQEAVDKILELQATLGLTRFAAHMDVGGPSHAALMKSIEMYGTQIAPKVREALKQTTTTTTGAGVSTST